MLFSKYFERHNGHPAFSTATPLPGTGIIVVIPCYDDAYIFKTLESLENTFEGRCAVEVIVVVNSGKESPQEIKENNRRIFRTLYEQSKNNYYQRFTLLTVLLEDIPRKKAGVGYARKAGMDEAVRHYMSLDHPDGIIASLDADCLVAQDYFIQLESVFSSKTGACVLQFQHNFDTSVFSKEEIEACKLYETYLRYFRLSLSSTGFPYCFHTIGSCFAVTAKTYINSGGMPQRQGGEDFYFLHKTAQSVDIKTINKPLVFPAPRVSTRVPFGTGPTVSNIITQGNYTVYNFRLFPILEKFFSAIPAFFRSDVPDFSGIPSEIIDFFGAAYLKDTIIECKSNSKEEKTFCKRFFSHFNALAIIKFLNSFDESSAFPPQHINEAANCLISHLSGTAETYSSDEAYDCLFALDRNE